MSAVNLPTPIRDAVDFYRQHPIVLVVVLVIAAGLIAAVLVDGGIDLTETVAVIATGAIVGVFIAALRALRQP